MCIGSGTILLHLPVMKSQAMHGAAWISSPWWVLWKKFQRLVSIVFDRFTESENGWGGKGPQGLPAPTPAQARTTKAGCPEPCPNSFGRSPRRRPHSLSVQAVPVLHHAQHRRASCVQAESPVLQFVPIASCPGTGHHWQESGSVLFVLTRSH